MKVGKLALVICVVFIVGVCIMANTCVSTEHKLNATDNLTKAQQIATEQNKDVFLVITSDSCMWCDKLEQETLSDEHVLKVLDEKYVSVIVNVEKQPEIAKSFKAIGTPVMVLMDSNGTEQARIDGYCGPEELIEYL